MDVIRHFQHFCRSKRLQAVPPVAYLRGDVLRGEANLPVLDRTLTLDEMMIKTSGAQARESWFFL